MKKNLFKIIALLAIGISLTFLSVTAVRADVTANFWTKAANGQLYTNSGNGLGNAVINVAGCNGCGGGGGGGVTSVGLSAPAAVFNVSGSPVTTSGTLALTFDNQAINTFFAGPASGGAGQPTFRALTVNDLPTIPTPGIDSVLAVGQQLTANRTINQNNFNLTLGTTNQGLSLIPSSGTSILAAYNATGGGNGANVLLSADGTSATSVVGSGFNGGTNTATIGTTSTSTLSQVEIVATQLRVNGSVGAAGEVLTSNGVGVAPTWSAVTGAQDLQAVLDTGNSAEDQSIELTSSTTANVATLDETGLIVDSGSTLKTKLANNALQLFRGANSIAVAVPSVVGSNYTQTLQDRTGTIANLDQIPAQAIDATSDALYSALIGAGIGGVPSNSVWLGLNAGVDVTAGSGSIYIGALAGYQAYSASNSTFIGDGSGRAAENASGAVFIGTSSGFQATNATNSVFLGNGAGYNSTNSSQSVAIGFNAGSGNSSASEGIWIGNGTGTNATGAANSVFIGTSAGNGAANAQNSIFIGKSAGNSDTVDNSGSTDDTSILIGQGSSTGGFKNSVAIGNGATNASENEFRISAPLNPFNSLYLDAGLIIPRIRTISTDDDALLSDYTILVDTQAASGLIKLNLDTNTPPIGQIYIVKDSGVNASANNIELQAGTIIGSTGGSSYTITTDGGSVMVQKVASGTWIVID